MQYDYQQHPDPTADPNPDQPPTTWERLKGWWWEILMSVATLAFMAAIVAVLVVMRDRPTTDWTFFLSIPATLAVFSTAAKSAAASALGSCISQSKWLHFLKPRKLADLDLIEDAARGPYGSAWLLLLRPRSLATIGAFLTIAALGYDTFIQQIVDLSPEDVFVDEPTAILGLNHYYNGGGTNAPGVGGVVNILASSADPNMQGAIYRGLYDLGSTPVVNCSSKCEWPGTYVSLGFAASCADVTKDTLDAHGNATGVWSKDSSFHPSRNLTVYILTTPGGVKLDGKFAHTGYQTVVSLGAAPRLNTSRSFTLGEEDYWVSPEIVRVAALRIKPHWSYLVEDPYKNMEIVQCDIDLVAYRYTNITSSGVNVTVGNQEIVRLNAGTVIPDQDVPRIYAVNFTQEGLPTLKVRGPDLGAVELFFTSNRFSGNIYDGEGFPAEAKDAGLGDAFRSGDMIAKFQSMVESMTSQLRSNFSDPAVVTGRSIRPVVFVRVRWQWLTLPAFVTIGAVVFTLITILKSIGYPNLPLWMGSTTAALTYDVRFPDGNENDSFAVGRLGTGVRNKKELKKYSDSIMAQLDLPETTRTYTTSSTWGTVENVYSRQKA